MFATYEVLNQIKLKAVLMCFPSRLYNVVLIFWIFEDIWARSLNNTDWQGINSRSSYVLVFSIKLYANLPGKKGEACAHGKLSNNWKTSQKLFLSVCVEIVFSICYLQGVYMVCKHEKVLLKLFFIFLFLLNNTELLYLSPLKGKKAFAWIQRKTFAPNE